MRSYIARIRKVIASGAPDVELVTRAPGYGLIGPRAGVDVHRFETLLDEGRRQLGAGDAALAGVTLRQALDVWRGDAYAEFAHEEWVLPEAQRLEELRVIAVERLVDAELACGRSAESIARARDARGGASAAGRVPQPTDARPVPVGPAGRRPARLSRLPHDARR